MNDMISRQAAITLPVFPKEYREYQTSNLDDAYEQGWMDCQEFIADLPSAEPRRGRWIKTYEYYPISGRCSSCGWNASYTQRDIVGYPYCPYCGAKMINGDEQDNPAGS